MSFRWLQGLGVVKKAREIRTQSGMRVVTRWFPKRPADRNSVTRSQTIYWKHGSCFTAEEIRLSDGVGSLVSKFILTWWLLNFDASRRPRCEAWLLQGKKRMTSLSECWWASAFGSPVDLSLGFFESFRVPWIRLERVKIAVKTYHLQRPIGGKTLSFK